MYNKLVERCFRECVSDMRSKALSGEEEKVGLATR
jgi:import inner membrane translocase subunit TIM9